jgi:hypothetical protein
VCACVCACVCIYLCTCLPRRLAEATWVSFDPIVSSPQLWVMDVLGSPVSPLTVVENGTRHVHAVWSGVSVTDAASKEAVVVASLDAPLVSPGDIDHVLLYEGWTQPDLSGGFHFNVHNNLWGTAFPQCASRVARRGVACCRASLIDHAPVCVSAGYGDDAMFRFEVTLTSASW